MTKTQIKGGGGPALIANTIGKRKGDDNTQPEKICKLQYTNQNNVHRGHGFLRCNLQILVLSAIPTTPAHCSIGDMQIVNRPRKEGHSKSVMLQGGTFEECDAAKPQCC